MQPDPQKRTQGILAVLCVVAVAGFLVWHHGGIHLPQESESALTAEIRTALDGDTEAAARYADLYGSLPRVLNSPKLKTDNDVTKLITTSREAMGQEHTEALVPMIERELSFLRDGKAEFTPEARSRLTAECKRLSAAFKAASQAKGPASMSDVLRQFADRMEARK